MAMKAVTGVGAPTYTSGVQEWNGTAPSLKSTPTVTVTSPSTSSDCPCVAVGMAAAIAENENEPEKP